MPSEGVGANVGTETCQMMIVSFAIAVGTVVLLGVFWRVLPRLLKD